MHDSLVTFIWGVIVGVVLTLVAMGLIFGRRKSVKGHR